MIVLRVYAGEDRSRRSPSCRNTQDQTLEEEPHADLHHALAGLAVDAAEHRRVGIGDDLSDRPDG